MSTKLDIKKGYIIFKEGDFSDCAYIKVQLNPDGSFVSFHLPDSAGNN